MRVTILNDQFKGLQQASIEKKALGANTGQDGNLQEGQIIKAKIKSILNEMILIELGNGKFIEAKYKDVAGHNLEKGSTYQFIVKAGDEGQILMKILGNEGLDIHHEDLSIIKFLEQTGMYPDKDKIQLVKLLLKAEMPVTEKMLLEITQTKLQFDKINDLLSSMKDVAEGQFLEKDLGQVLKELIKKPEQQSHGDKTILMDTLGTSKAMSLGAGYTSKLIEGKEQELLSKATDSKNNNFTGNSGRINVEGMDFEKIIFMLKNGLKVNLKNATALNDMVFRQYPMSRQFEEIIQTLMNDEKTTKLGMSLKETISKMQDALIHRKPEFQEALRELYTKAELIKLKMMSLESAHQKDIVNQLENFKNNIDFLGKLNPLQTFLQVPIEIGNIHRNLELIIVQERGKSKKINPKDVKLLVSLETKNMAFVQALIEIKEKSITCNFRVEHEHARAVIQSHQKSLENVLIKYGFVNVYFHYAVSQRETYLINTTDKDADLKHHSVDLKV